MQSDLFNKTIEFISESKIVNVASIPQRSPFRYPGGKTWFVPNFRKWINSRQEKSELLIEPFVGGGVISLTAAFENLVDKVLMVELDEQVAAVWQTIVDGNAKWLASKIIKFNLTKENLFAEIDIKPVDIKQLAFQTILKNRTFHGGILAEGAGISKNGENGKGIHSRWYPRTLARRIELIDYVLDKIEFKHGDGLRVIENYRNNKGAIFFIDPPYTAGGKKAGKRLYKYSNLDHDRLFKLCKSIKGDFIMTYDNAEEVRDLAGQNGFEFRRVPMKNTHNAEMTELVIGRDLSWMDF